MKELNGEGKLNGRPFRATHYYLKYSRPQRAIGMDFINSDTGETLTIVVSFEKARELAHKLGITAAYASEKIVQSDGSKV